ncbi:type I restriction enzyme, S subunit [Lachnospiraceae bacterium XPB1003]|nr:type I restriction enzyme, S subunit [Lachnospiraceae bacterium XPB1003]
MDDIKRVRLGDIAELITKGTTPTTLGYDFQDEGINFLKIECFDENGSFLPEKVAFISEECNEKLKRSQLKEGDVLFSIAGAIGRVAIVTEEMLPANTNQALAIIRITDENVYLPYIKLILTSPIVKKQFEKKKQGVAQLNLSLKDINEIVIPLPDKKRQIEYAELFGKLFGVITLRNTQLSDMDNLIKARFVELFGTPGQDEKGWGLKQLGECCEINPKKGSDSRLVSGLEVSFVPMPSVSETGDIDTSELRVFDDVKTGFTYFAEKDVLFAKITPCMENGKGAVAVGLCNGIGFGSTEFHVLRSMEGGSNPYWLYSVTSFSSFRKDAEANMTGSAGQRRVPASFLENYKISLPPIELQNRFEDFVKQVDKSKVAVKKALDETKLLFDSLMQEYFG